MEGKVEKINVENGYIKISNKLFRFNFPYTTKAGKTMSSGALLMVVDKDGNLKVNEGDSVEYSYGNDGGVDFIKFIKKIEPGEEKPAEKGGFASPKTYGRSVEEQSFIYRQHAEKVVGEFLITVMKETGTIPDVVNHETVLNFCDLVSIGAEAMRKRAMWDCFKVKP